MVGSFGYQVFAATAGIPISVPSSTGRGFFLVSTSTGAYIATTTDPAHFGSIFATTTTATSTFLGGLSTLLLNITSTTATSTAANGINLSAGCFAINGVCAGTGAGTITGSGTAGRATFWDGASSITSDSTFLFDGTTDRLTFTYGTSTALSVSSSFAVTPLTSALTLTGADGTFAEYAGTTCTNQFVRILSALGVATCETVSLTADVSGVLPIANGGTNASSFTTTNNGVAWDGTRLITAPLTTAITYPFASTTAITSTTASTTNLIVSGMTNGSALFAGTAGLLSQDNTNYFWDDTNNFLGLGTASPLNRLSVRSDSGNTTLTSEAGIAALANLDTTNNNFVTLEYGALNTVAAPVSLGFLSMQATDHTAGSVDSDFIIAPVAASTIAERLRVKNTGEVGIGDTTPDFLLDVAGTFGVDGNITLGDASGDTVTVNSDAWTFANDTTVALSGGVNGLNFDSNTLSIDATNNRIGIGTTTPPAGTPLQVSLNDLTRALGTSLVISDQGAAADLKHWGMNTLNGSLRFGTVNDSLSTVTNRLTILNGGNIGIGTTSPTDAGQTNASKVLNMDLSTGFPLLSFTSGDTADTSIYGMVGFGLSETDGAEGRVASIYGASDGSSAASANGKINFTTSNAGSVAVNMVLDKNGDLGLATTSPWGRLSIIQLGTSGNPAFIVEDVLNDTTPFVITQAGDVGISDGSPGFTLDVGGSFGTSGNVTFGDAVGDTVTSNAGAWTFANDTTVALSGGVNGINFDSDTLSIDATDNRVGIGTTTPFYPLTVASATEPQLALSAGAGIAQWAFRNVNSNLYIATTTVAGTATSTLSAVTILGSNGYMGLGENSPDDPFHIKHGAGVSESMKIETTDNASNVVIGMQDSSPGQARFLAFNFLDSGGAADGQVGYQQNSTGASQYMRLLVNGADRLHIDGSGNVGIGDASPDFFFDVEGASAFNGLMTLSGTASNIALGSNFLSGDGGDEGVSVSSAGLVGVASSTPWRNLSVTGTVGLSSTLGTEAGASDDALCIDTGTFEMERNSGATTCLLSARRYKENIKALQGSEINKIMALKPVTYNLISDPDKRTKTGLIAEDVEKVIPSAVAYNNKGETHSLEYSDITATLIKAFQSFYKEFQSSLARISGLEKKFESQQKEIELLKIRLNKLEK